MKILKDELVDLIKKDRTIYTAKQVRDAWQSNTKLSHFNLLLDDSQYYGLPQGTWEKIMSESDTHSYKYIPEFRDCDDFAFLFKGELVQAAMNGCGLVFNTGGKHAYNVGLISGKDAPSFRFIEPQEDNWIITDSEPYYSSAGPGLVIM